MSVSCFRRAASTLAASAGLALLEGADAGTFVFFWQAEIETLPTPSAKTTTVKARCLITKRLRQSPFR
jgi:hypothetical protein